MNRIITSLEKFRNISPLNESVKNARKFLDTGKINQEDFDRIIELDPSKNNKFSPWIVKQFIAGEINDWSELANVITEFNVLLEKGKSKTKDIFQFKKYSDLKKELDTLNNTGDNLSLKDLESEYDVILDNEDLYIACPHTHEASRKLGLTTFAYINEDGTRTDSKWCTTYKNPSHFNDYYHRYNITFFYVLVRSEKLKNKFKEAFPNKYKDLMVMSIHIYDNESSKKNINDKRLYNDGEYLYEFTTMPNYVLNYNDSKKVLDILNIF